MSLSSILDTFPKLLKSVGAGAWSRLERLEVGRDEKETLDVKYVD
jgi:hypothetical protein